jgi:glucose-1-phosphate thymidylyltransferase
VVTDRDGYMTKIVEKPSTPISKLANIGLYWIRDVEGLWHGIDHVLGQPTVKGEYFLTDAFQQMIERGRRILTAEVGGWYDCGQLGTTLETNGILLEQGAAQRPQFGSDVTIVEPVLIEEGCTIETSTIGPNVTLEAGSVVRHSQVSDSIIGAKCTIEGSTLHHAMLGDRVTVRGHHGTASLGSDSELVGEA